MTHNSRVPWSKVRLIVSSKQSYRRMIVAGLLLTAVTAAAAPSTATPSLDWEGLRPLEAAAPDRPVQWPASPVSGFYYIDSSSPNATDNENRFGYPDRPRATIPEIDYPAGSYVEIHGGPYTGGSQIIFAAHGTREAPVWIRGPGSNARAVIRGEMIVKGSYVFIENLRFDTNKTLGLRPHRSSTLNHAVVRDCEFDGPGTDVGSNSAIAVSGLAGPGRYSDIVISNNRIHGFGDRNARQENDFHGIGVGGNVDRIWILGNEIFDMGGDAVQIGAASVPNDRRATAVYIANNSFYDNRENAVDIKNSQDVIVSHNVMYGFRTSSSSDGAAIVIHNNPDRVWIVGNTISRSNHGVVNTGGRDVWVVSNVFYDIHHASADWDPQDLYSGGSVIHFRGESGGGIVNNTLYRYDTGIQLAQGSSGYSLFNVLFSERTEPEGFDVIAKDKDVVDESRLRNLAFFQRDGARVMLRGRVYTDRDLQGGRNKICTSCLTGDSEPLMDAAGYDFRLKPGSAAVDKGFAAQAVFDLAAAQYVDIATDMAGNRRIQGHAIDIGALESNPPP